MSAIVEAGILLPMSVMTQEWFMVLAAFVALNTLVYVTLAVVKLFPVVRFGRRGGRNRRSETRSIFPNDPV